MNAKHWDCWGQKNNCEAFYGYETELELLTAIHSWWCGIFINNEIANLQAINLSVNDEGDDNVSYGALVLWSA